MDTFIDKVRDPFPFIQFFTRLVKSGLLDHNRELVRSRTSDEYLWAVGQTFANMGIVDPHLNKHGSIDYRIQWQL